MIFYTTNVLMMVLLILSFQRIPPSHDLHGPALEQSLHQARLQLGQVGMVIAIRGLDNG